MADGFDIHISAEQAEKLRALADRLGVSPKAYAALLIDREIELANGPATNPDPAIDRAILEDAKRSAGFAPWPEVRDRLLARHLR